MKILFVQKMAGISGSELYLLQIMPELRRRGFDVEMLIIYPAKTNNNERFVSYLADHGIQTHEIYGHRTLSPFLFYKFYQLLSKRKFHLIQSNLVHADVLVSLTKLIFAPTLKFVSVKHGYDPGYQAKYGFDLKWVKCGLFYWVEKFASRQANFNITISKGLYRVFTERGIISSSRIQNIYYGLTLREPVEKNQSLKVPDGPYALIIGRLVGFKGHKYLIDSWKKVRAKVPELKLYISGNGELYEELNILIQNSGLNDDVYLLGHTPNPHPLIKNSLFTIVTSTWEGFGLILLESWLHKKAIIAFDVPAMNEVIDDGIDGLLVPFKDTDTLAKKIIWMYKHQKEAKQMGERGFEKFNSYYTLQRMTDETESVYKKVLSNL